MSIQMSDAIPESKRHTRFGKNYWGIDFDINPEITAKQFLEKSKNSPNIGELTIGQKKFQITYHECDRLIETLMEARNSLYQKYNLNLMK